MKAKVSDLLADEKPSDLKFMIFSAHDDQVTNMLNFLATDYYWVPYASTVTFELKYSVSCLVSDAPTESCFGVAIIFNGKPLSFPGCSGDGFILEGCSFPEFLALMDTKWYSGPSADDLDAACMQKVTNV